MSIIRTALVVLLAIVACGGSTTAPAIGFSAPHADAIDPIGAGAGPMHEKASRMLSV